MKYNLNLNTFGSSALIEKEEVELQPEKAEEQKQNYLIVPHGKMTDALARMGNRDIRKDSFTSLMEVGGVRASSQLITDDVKDVLGINAHKLLMTGISYFATRNNISYRSDKAMEYNVYIPFEYYAQELGYKLDYDYTGNEEEDKKIKKKIDYNIKNAKKAINKDMGSLSDYKFSWQEKVKGSRTPENFLNVKLVGTHGISNGYIYMVLDPAFASYLTRCTLTSYPTGLMKIDARNGNAYNLGLFMASHYNMYSNQEKHTHNILKVATLLKYTELPDYAYISKYRYDFKKRVKDPFEKALYTLEQVGVIAEGWYYAHSKGIKLTDDELCDIDKDYVTYSEQYIVFEVIGAPDHSARIKAKAIEKAEREQKLKEKNKANAAYNNRKAKEAEAEAAKAEASKAEAAAREAEAKLKLIKMPKD